MASTATTRNPKTISSESHSAPAALIFGQPTAPDVGPTHDGAGEGDAEADAETEAEEEAEAEGEGENSSFMINIKQPQSVRRWSPATLAYRESPLSSRIDSD